MDVLLPPLAWQAGKVAAAVRFAAVTALATMLHRGALPLNDLHYLIDSERLLDHLAQVGRQSRVPSMREGRCGMCPLARAETHTSGSKPRAGLPPPPMWSDPHFSSPSSRARDARI
jgi:hypothetical protein